MTTDKNRKKRDDSPDDPEQHDAATEPIVRDKRRIDPETGEARKGADEVGEQLTDEDLARLLEEPVPAEADSGSDSASEHLHDLKRVQAEYANYRKRVERDRYVARELAVAEVITSILPVLDDLDLAHAHGDLEGSPLELVAQKLRKIFGRYGLVQVGEVGEPFDPNFHEAIAQVPSKDATGDTIAEVVQAGYRLGDRLLRPAKVAVSVPEE
jgi:molecular chaperone GrpE